MLSPLPREPFRLRVRPRMSIFRIVHLFYYCPQIVYLCLLSGNISHECIVTGRKHIGIFLLSSVLIYVFTSSFAQNGG